MPSKVLIAVMASATALTQTDKVATTVSIFEYKLWTDGQYHFAISDLATTVGTITGVATLVLIGYKIYRFYKS